MDEVINVLLEWREVHSVGDSDQNKVVVEITQQSSERRRNIPVIDSSSLT